VIVCDRETQTPGIAEELVLAKSNYPYERPPVFRGISPGKIHPEKAVYEKFRELLGNLNLAKTRIGELRPLVAWQKSAHPVGYDPTLENQLREWEETQKELENDWWVYNFPDPTVRAQEQVRRRFYRTNELEVLKNPGGPSLTGPTPGPPSNLVFKDTPEVYEAELAVRAAREGDLCAVSRRIYLPNQGSHKARARVQILPQGHRRDKRPLAERLGAVNPSQKPSWKGPQVQGSSRPKGLPKANAEEVVIVDEGLNPPPLCTAA
jgi:hypothetical protein